MKTKLLLLIFIILTCFQCKETIQSGYSKSEKSYITDQIQKEIDTLILAVSTKNIDLYMKKMPQDFVIYDENGSQISREQQREFALRDWSIIDTTLNNAMIIDSIDFASIDSIYVYTFQKWERLMFQRDGITLDTVLTTQKHRELWKKRDAEWIGYDVEEIGGEIFINGKKYDPN
ncbi:hypothetical protein [Aquimarina rubra]|uniref:Nuclear transport factor 2 family protein n=1 Tax=Aquimarina rubra TaxID=1920033 RepID=A0ABW5LKN1_9FLAO